MTGKQTTKKAGKQEVKGSTLTLRLSPSEANLLDCVKQVTNEQAGSKAIIKAMKVCVEDYEVLKSDHDKLEKMYYDLKQQHKLLCSLVYSRTRIEDKIQDILEEQAGDLADLTLDYDYNINRAARDREVDIELERLRSEIEDE